MGVTFAFDDEHYNNNNNNNNNNMLTLVLVTGAIGFIGSSLIKSLLA
jgi:FlaA1/EpsC-like NDP-sugar epimerase